MPAWVAMSYIRHADVGLTLETYADVELLNETEALAALPPLSLETPSEVRPASSSTVLDGADGAHGREAFSQPHGNPGNPARCAVGELDRQTSSSNGSTMAKHNDQTSVRDGEESLGPEADEELGLQFLEDLNRFRQFRSFKALVEQRDPALQSKVWDLLAECGDDPAKLSAQRWTGLLHDQNPIVRASAAREFRPISKGASGNPKYPLIEVEPAAVPAMARELCELIERKDSTPEIKVACIESLSRFGNEAALEAVPVLSKLIARGHARVRESAIRAMPFFRATAYTAVATISDVLNCDSKELRLAACSTLEQLGSDAARAIPRLVDAVLRCDDRDERYEIVRALVRIDPAGKSIGERNDTPRDRGRFLDSLRDLGVEAIPLWNALHRKWFPPDDVFASQSRGGQPFASSGAAGPKRGKRRRPIRSIESWAELAIGIDDTDPVNRRYYAIIPSVKLGEPVDLLDTNRVFILKTKSRDFKAILDVIANSSDGKTADKELLKKSLSITKFSGDTTRSQVRSEHITREFDPTDDRLNDKMSEFRRFLLDAFPNKYRDPSVETEKASSYYRSKFIVAFLGVSRDGKPRFGEAGRS